MKNWLKQKWEWTKDGVTRFKKWIIIVIFGGSAIAASLIVPTSDTSQVQLLEKIRVAQDNYYQKEGKYFHSDKNDLKNRIDSLGTMDYEVRIDEYKKPDGTRGYWIFTETDTEWKRVQVENDILTSTTKVISKKASI